MENDNMKKILIMLLLAFTAGLLLSQTIADYTYATATDASLYDMSTGTTDLLATGTYYDDTASAVTDIGFFSRWVALVTPSSRSVLMA